MKLQLFYKNEGSSLYSLEDLTEEQINDILFTLEGAMRNNLIVSLGLKEVTLIINAEELVQVTLIK